MAKFSRQTVWKTGAGPIKAEIEAWGGALALFSQAARNAIIRDALWQGGEYYRAVFLPLKFSNYAKKFGYHVAARYLKRKLAKYGHDTPLVFTGDMQDQILSKAKTRATATASKSFVDIIQPGPGYMNATQAVYSVLRSALPSEIERMAPIVARSIADQMEGVASARGGAAPLRKLTAGQTALFSRSTYHRAQKGPRAAPGQQSRKAS